MPRTRRPESFVSLTCQSCGNPFMREHWRVSAGEDKHCSKPCYFAAKSNASNEAFWKLALEVESGCWEWQGSRTVQGYGRVRMPEKRGGVIKAHRRAWELASGEIPDGLLVLHHCDNRPCVRPDHLFLGTAYDNMRDMSQKGRAAGFKRKGANHPLAKLTQAQVDDIRSRVWKHGKYAEWAREFGVTDGTVRSIYRGDSW